MVAKAKLTYIGGRVNRSTKEALEQIARREHRSLANLINRICLEYLKTKGVDDNGNEKEESETINRSVNPGFEEGGK
jgi:hypothetical protein